MNMKQEQQNKDLIRGAGADARQALHLLLNEGREKETSDLSRLDSKRSGIYKEFDKRKRQGHLKTTKAI